MAVTTIDNFGALKQSTTCVHCKHPVDLCGRFCGECGAPSSKSKPRVIQDSFAASFQKTAAVVPPHIPHHGPHANGTNSKSTVASTATPNFARVGNRRRKISPELQAEMASVVCSLARERMFLFFHCGVFLTVNSFGLFLAFTAYNGYIGDEITKTIMALTPMFFINTVALACLSPIKGTKIEIERIKEKLKYLKSQVEYSGLF